MTEIRYNRVVLKIGGKAFAGPEGFGIDPERAREIAFKIKRVKDLGAEIVIVPGAGNIWRGRNGMTFGMDRATADHMGMLGTVMNSLALGDALERAGVEARIQTAIEMKRIAEPYIRLRAIRHLRKGRVVIVGAGTGSPYFTTDTAAALRAMEVRADILVKATDVNGIYEEDPRVNPEAEKFESLSYKKALDLQIGVLDSTAISLCMNNHLPILVINLWQPRSLEKAVLGEEIGSQILWEV